MPLEIAIGDVVGGAGRVSTTYGELARAVQAGDRLLLDDGKIELEVEGSDGADDPHARAERRRSSASTRASTRRTCRCRRER